MSALDRAERALQFVSGADGAVATVTAERSLLLRFARSRPTQATAIDDATTAITVLRDGQVGSASTNRDDDDSLRSCAAAATAAADTAARTRGSGSYPGFPSAAPPRAHEGFDAVTAELDPAVGGQALETAFATAAAHEVEAHGVWSAGEVETAIVSTSGVAVSDRVTDAFMKATCFATDGRSGWANHTAVRVDELDAAALTEAAAARASGAFAASREPQKLAPGEYAVVLAPAALGEMIDWLASGAFNGLAHVEGRGALCGKLGTKVVSPSVNISDSPRYARTLPRAFDAEGVPKDPLPLIQDGIALNVCHDTRSAALTPDGVSTGHALAAGGASLGALPTNLVMVGGGAADEAELCGTIERGVYVTRLWYTNAVRLNETLITGVTRDGTFLIEDGVIAAPLDDLRVTDSVLGVLERTEALTGATHLWSEGEFYGRRFATGNVVPAIRSTLRFSGGA